MKQTLLAIAFAGCLLAQTTTVTQVVVSANGSPASGEAIIRISNACDSGANHVGTTPIRVRFQAGSQGVANFSVNLVPNDTCTPGPNTYSVTWVLAGGQQWSETWAVPTSENPVSVADVIISPTAPTGPAWTRGTFSVAVTQPLTSDTGLVQYADQYAYSISVVSCSTDTGTATINLDVRTQAAPNTAGTSVLGSALTCSATGTSTSALSPTVAVPANAPVDLQVLSVSGSPNVLRVFVSKSAQ